MRYLLLVRHSNPQIDPKIESKCWKLSEIGKVKARGIGAKILKYSPELIFTSNEVKAMETAEIIACLCKQKIIVKKRLHEHKRGVMGNKSEEEFQNGIRALFEYPEKLVFGEETAVDAGKRISEEIKKIENYKKDNICVVSHGVVISLYAARYMNETPYKIWKILSLPSCIVLDQEAKRVIDVISSD